IFDEQALHYMRTSGIVSINTLLQYLTPEARARLILSLGGMKPGGLLLSGDIAGEKTLFVNNGIPPEVWAEFHKKFELIAEPVREDERTVPETVWQKKADVAEPVPAAPRQNEPEQELPIEVREQPALDDIRESRNLTKNLIESAISILLSHDSPRPGMPSRTGERRLVLAFHENLAGLSDKKLARVLTELEELKKKDGFDALLKNLTITRSMQEYREKTQQGGGIDPRDPNTIVFMFAPEDERNNIDTAAEVKKVFIGQKDKNGNLFDAISYFYPLPEIVAMTLVSFQNRLDADGLNDTLSKLGIKPEEINIHNITEDGSSFLIFNLIGRIERYDHQSRDRYIRIQNAIRAAA
ncbi:MAG: hypothetical protein PHS37_05765, partial [Candidatus Omnitrophica bacterium]|nr:hypothetical protein [Candidatus Omnitrophota bacterium]